ncbi:peptide MFS transporter [Brevundimonas aveniformis]|uniref:peptide MFS transporter n=1 Tax=Brevundimonas aveniformis TaxID=370977 RepID=UPI002493BAC7|nr:oligopeptide:H+ symporter [Brevundimonas aveniformis]
MNIVILLGVLVTLVTGLPVLMQMLRNHPKGLIILFFAEMWERFSYYGMRGLLIFYLTQHFLFDDAQASETYGSYTSLVYLLPLLGGIIADRWLGTRKAIAFGALLLVAGHSLMAYEGRPATETLTYQGQTYEIAAEGRADLREVGIVVNGQTYSFGPAEGGGIAIEGLPAGSPLPTVLGEDSYVMQQSQDQNGLNSFYLAVSLIIMGVAFLKPNISSIVGQLYPQGDPRRDSGFTLYYYGINLGAFWAAVLCGYLGQTVGWWAGFGLAGVGMALGWIVFVLGKPLLQGNGEPPHPERLAEPFVGPINREWLIYGLGILAVPVVWIMVQRNALVGTVLGFATIASLIAIILIILLGAKTWMQRKHMILATVLIGGAVVFWTLFEQAGTSLNLFTDRNVDLNLTAAATQFMGMWWGTPAQLANAGITPSGLWIDTTLTAAQTQSFNAGYILIFAPIFAALWTNLGRQGRDPNPLLKFALGLLQAGLGFLVVVWGVNAGFVNEAFRAPLFLLAALYLLHTTGELCLSPVGLSQITKLSLPSVVSFMMAVWFLASSIAQFVGGKIAAALGTETVGGQVLDPAGALSTSLGGFQQMGYAGLICGAVFLVLSFIMGKWGEGSDDAGTPAPDPRIEDSAADIDEATGERTA